MNKSILNITILALFIFFGCSKDDGPELSKDKESLKISIQSTSWILSYFFDNNKDETNQFNGYEFSFRDNNKLIASNGQDTMNGYWQINDNGNDDSPGNLELEIEFVLNNHFDDLSDDWEVVNVLENKIELTDISGGNGGIDHLHFVNK